MDVTDSEAMEISLIREFQRKDLDLFEEADGLKALIEIYKLQPRRYFPEKIGKARSTITEIITFPESRLHLRQACHAPAWTRIEAS